MIFRAKRLDTGGWVEGDLLNSRNRIGEIENMIRYEVIGEDGKKLMIFCETVDPATLQQKIGEHWLTPVEVEALRDCSNCGRFVGECANEYGKDGHTIFYRCNQMEPKQQHWQPRATAESEGT
jgi:hypothetical protein